MNNINTIDKVAYTPTKSSKWRNFKYGVVLLSLLNLSSPATAQNTNSDNNNTNGIELSISSSDDKEKHDGYSIPSVYKDKIEAILKENLPIVELNGTNSWMFTMDFVLKEMESDRGISKDNQLLFIWNNICKQLTGEYVYEGDDGESKRTEELKKAFRSAFLCGKRYREGIMPFIEKKVADAQQRSADAQQRSADAQQRSADAQQRSADAQQRSAEYDRQIAQNKQQIAQNKQQIAEYNRQIAESKEGTEKTISKALDAVIIFYDTYNLAPDNEILKNCNQSLEKFISVCEEAGYSREDIKNIWIKRVGKDKLDSIMSTLGLN